jgi:hypothetical protein
VGSAPEATPVLDGDQWLLGAYLELLDRPCDVAHRQNYDFQGPIHGIRPYVERRRPSAR